jgi:hypothetical protein
MDECLWIVLLRSLVGIDNGTGLHPVWITPAEKNLYWEDTRGLGKSELLEIAKGTFVNADRDFSAYLNNWEMVRDL